MSKKAPKEFNPRQAIDNAIEQIRTGRGNNYRYINDEELFAILLTGYELGCSNTLDVLKPGINQGAGILSKSRKLNKRLDDLEAVLRVGQPAANEVIAP